ncbi:hypothetical protein LXL04_005606 [Taraxacum kok-saghyz]
MKLHLWSDLLSAKEMIMAGFPSDYTLMGDIDCSRIQNEYQKNFGDSWKAVQAYQSQSWPYLDEALNIFQGPA